MNIKAANAIFANLTLAIDLLADQRAFHRVLLGAICETPEKYELLQEQIKEEVNKERELVRAVVFQFAEVDSNDLLNGTFEI